MAWRRPGAKPLSETMMVRLLTHICVTRPQWVKWQSSDMMSYLTSSSQYCIIVAISASYQIMLSFLRMAKKQRHSLHWQHNGRDGVSIICSTACSGADQRKHQSSASLAFVRGIHRWPVNPHHKKASDIENVSIWWRHHVGEITYCMGPANKGLLTKRCSFDEMDDWFVCCASFTVCHWQHKLSIHMHYRHIPVQYLKMLSKCYDTKYYVAMMLSMTCVHESLVVTYCVHFCAEWVDRYRFSTCKTIKPRKPNDLINKNIL